MTRRRLHGDGVLLLCYLHVNQELPKTAWRHHNSGVELNNVAFVQSDVVVSSQSLRQEKGKPS